MIRFSGFFDSTSQAREVSIQNVLKLILLCQLAFLHRICMSTVDQVTLHKLHLLTSVLAWRSIIILTSYKSNVDAKPASESTIRPIISRSNHETSTSILNGASCWSVRLQTGPAME